ncbi:MAG: hypothetical protein M3308_05680 [Actinomycetota bacterium]|nr:hypothetical protein [Actinomycetota bacterium]
MPFPSLRLHPPAGFVSLPLDPDLEHRRLGARELAEQMSRAAGLSVEELTEAVLAVGERVGAVNVRLLGSYAVASSGGGDPATAAMALAVQELRASKPELIAEDRSYVTSALRELVQRRSPDAASRVVQLPCGPAVAAVLFGEFRIPPDRSGRDAEVTVPVHRAQFLIPVPTGRHLVVLEVNTGSELAWPAVAEQAVATARSIRFQDVSSLSEAS